MNKKFLGLLSCAVIFFIMMLSGCENILPESPLTYVKTPTTLMYNLTYGYLVNSTGSGTYDITYLCDLPEVLQGALTTSILYKQQYQNVFMVNNTFVQWNITGTTDQQLTLGIVTHVTSESFLVSDLTGASALSLQDLPQLYPALVTQYTGQQGNSSTIFIDPRDSSIVTIATEIRSTTGTNNSFLLAKALFIWLKEHVQYQTHSAEGVQPARETLQKGTGDCDDLSFLYLSLCRAVGIPARFIRGYLITSTGNSTAMAVAHAWAEIFVGGSLGRDGWIPVECACCTTSIQADVNQNFGVENAYHLRLFTDDGSNQSLEISFTGISYVIYGINRHITTTPLAVVSHYQELTLQNLVITSSNTRYYQ